MTGVERVGSWPKSANTFGNSTDYSKQSERYSLEFLSHCYRLGPSEARHLGGGDEPDGVLSRNGQDFATVEVRLHMELFPDDDKPNGSGWPQVNEVIGRSPSIPLDAELGTWALWVYPNAGAIRQLISEPQAGALLSNFIRQSLTSGTAPPLPRELLALAPIQDIFPLRSGIADECIVIPRVPPYGGSFSLSNDHIAAYMQQRIARWTEISPTRRSYVDKWGDRAVQLGVREIHVVGIFENTMEWMRTGIMHQLMDPIAAFPSAPLDLSGFPSLDWNLWLLLRNPTNGDFHRAYRYSDFVWTTILE